LRDCDQAGEVVNVIIHNPNGTTVTKRALVDRIGCNTGKCAYTAFRP
jgi:hypothetical protein